MTPPITEEDWMRVTSVLSVSCDIFLFNYTILGDFYIFHLNILVAEMKYKRTLLVILICFRKCLLDVYTWVLIPFRAPPPLL